MSAPRRTYTMGKKLEMVKEAVECMENGHSLRATASHLNIDPSQLRRWIEIADKLEDVIKKKGCATSLTTHAGRQSCLKNIEDDLLMFIFECREQGMCVSVRTVALKACELDNSFHRKSDRAKDQSICRFVKAHGLVHRVHTHESQRPPHEVANEATDFIVRIRPLLRGMFSHEDWIINMDQTPVFFLMVPRTTLDHVGARTVNVRTSTNSTMRVTVAVTVTASGKMLPPLIVFKGKGGGRIELEFVNFNQGAAYAVQPKAWMDEDVMKFWMETILIPYVMSAPAGVHPFLLLDS